MSTLPLDGSESSDRSIVMIEWSRLVTPSHKHRDEFLWHQMFMSLLYDDVLAQDQTILCSEEMASWFGDPDGFRLVAELLECRGLVILDRPAVRYPPWMRERLSREPIGTRREQLIRFSAHNDGRPVSFSPKQLSFHNLLENYLREPVNSRSHREAGRRGFNIMDRFARLTKEVLTDSRYTPWLASEFGQITPDVAAEFVRYAEEPKRAIDRLHTHRRDEAPRVTPLSKDLQFSTALAVQVAATYPKRVATELQSFVETVFARPFCDDEGADGRYGRLLQSLPTEPELEGAGELIRLVHAEPMTLHLPAPRPGFGSVINRIREMPSGRRLKREMEQLGRDPKFVAVTAAWKDVAADMAALMHSSAAKEVELKAVVVELGKSIVTGVIFGDVIATAVHGLGHSLPFVEATAIGLTLPLYERMQNKGFSRLATEWKRQKTEERLADAIQFSCVQSTGSYSGS